MIYWFSGTGNSHFVATELGKALGQELQFMPTATFTASSIEPNGIGLVFPVYSWGVPPIVLDFITRLPKEIITESGYVWAVMTCGDETAQAPEMLARALRHRGMRLNACWSIIMPNNYVLLPGFDVDPKDIALQKLNAAPARIARIADEIRKQLQGIDVTRGSYPHLKSMVWPLFKRWGVFPSKWRYTDECVGCGRCAAVCPTNNITIVDIHPVWGSDCCSCVACYHSCKSKAIQYGKFTQGKGQYILSDFKTCE